MRITKKQFRQIIRESILKKGVNLHEAGVARKLFGWMKNKDWEQEVERIDTAENIKTIGDLKFVLDLAKLAKTDEKAEKAWASFGSGFLADLAGGGTVKSLIDVVKDTYEAPDEATGGTALDYLNVDDGIAKIVDDPIENAYIEELEDMIAGEDPETPLEDFDVTKGLATFIKKNIDDRTVTGWTGQQEGRKKMRISKRQLKRIIREENNKLLRKSTRHNRLRRVIREQMEMAAEEEEQRAGASSGALKKWFVEKSASIADLNIPGAQIPALVAAMEDLIATAAAGKMKAQEKRLSGQIAKAGGL